MAAKRRTSWVVWLRRAAQTGFTALFLFLFLDTVYHPVNRTNSQGKLFFELDPLVLLSSWIAGHQVVAGLLFSLAVVGVTLVAGRWFCGWVCPLGALHNLVASLRRARAKDKIAAGRASAWQRAKYYVLLVALGSALLGLNLAGWLDPFSLFFRSLATVIFPVLSDGVTAIAAWIYDTDPHLGSFHLTALTEPVYEVLRRHALPAAQPYYYGSLLIALVFVAAVALNFYRPRFWCRFLCPLGALLGIVGKNPLVRLKQDAAACNNCGLCTADCPGGAGPDPPGRWKPAECFYCWNCKSACPNQALSFAPGFFLRPPRAERLDLGRRAILLAGAGGLGAAMVQRSSALGKGRTFSPSLIRPPGSVAEPDFLAKCVRCGECMKVCPTNAIQPALNEGGVEGLWTPVLKMKMGYCEYECNLCAQVCPTQAIRLLPLAEKQKVRIGLAFFDRNRCLPYASARTCIVCEEHCPTPQKAIWFEEVTVLNARGERVVVKQPRVNAELCTGCGICENKCPLADERGVYVTSVGETRNPKNQILLSTSYSS